MKKTTITVFTTVMVMLLIPTMAYLTLRSPAIQTYIAGKAAEYLSRELGATITVGGVNISRNLHIILEEVEILDRHQHHILDSKRIIVDLRRFLPGRRFLLLDKVVFDKANVTALRHYNEESFNFQFLIDYLAKDSSTDTINRLPWDVIVRSFEFRNSSVCMTDYNFEHIGFGFDPNNFAFKNINMLVEDIILVQDTLTASLKSFSVDEDYGFSVKSVTSDIMVSPQGSTFKKTRIETEKSLLFLNLKLNYEGYAALEDFIDAVSMEADISPSYLNLYDIGYFTPGLYGMDGKIDISGRLSGKISNLRGNDLVLKYGALTQFEGNFSMIGLPDIYETFINLSINRLVTFHSDLASFKLPKNMGTAAHFIPAEFANLGVTSFSGNFTGFLYNFVSFGLFNTSMGSFSTNLAIISDNEFRKFNYRGKISTRSFRFGKLIGDTENFGNIALNASVEGTGHTIDKLDLRITGQIDLLQFRGYEYRKMQIAGNFINRMFSGKFNVNDPHLMLDFSGVVDFRDELPIMNFVAQIDNANLTRLNIYQRDSLHYSILSTKVHVNAKGSNPDNIYGEANAYSAVYSEKKIQNTDEPPVELIHTDVFGIENTIQENGYREFRLFSDFIDVMIGGTIDPGKVVSDFNRFFHTFAPSVFAAPKDTENNSSGIQDANISIHLKKTSTLTSLFFPWLEISSHTYLTGHFKSVINELAINGHFDYLRLGGYLLDRPEINIYSDPANLELTLRGNNLFLTDSLRMEQFFVSGMLFSDTLMMLTQWENRGSQNRNLGSIKTRGRLLSPRSAEFSVLPSYAYLNDSLWTFSPNNRIIVDSTAISIRNFRVYKKDEYLLVNGNLTGRPEDVLDIKVQNFNIESFNFLLGERKIHFSGIANGDLKLSNLQNSPGVMAELKINRFAFNRDHLGDLSLSSTWDAVEKAFKINTEIIYHGNVGSNKPVIASGYFYPERENDNFDLDIVIENFKMSVFGRYISDFASNFRGLASGRLKLRGPLSAPELSGRARLVRTGFRVDYLNTSYSFAHEVEIGKDYIRFDNLLLSDTLGNNGRVTGILRHRNFYDFSVDVTIRPERMVVLNTQPHHNELFYGKAFATGLVHVHGPVNDIKIDVAATANRGTQFFLPLDYLGEVSESSFISFVKPGHDKHSQAVFQKPSNFGLTLNFDLTVTPEAEIQIIFDSKIGDIMRGRGFGDLKVEVDKQGFITMYGDYNIQEGEYLFTLQNLINKRFRIEQGGMIRWTGDLYDADVDLKAIYRLRTTLFDLAASQTDTSDVLRRRVPVETVLHLTNKLFNPSVSFSIQLPGSDESTREMIDRLITTEQEMNRQVFSLLILNRFVPPDEGINNALGYGMGTTSAELLSNQLSNWLSQISSDVDIGVNIRPGDELSAQEVELALSTQLFNDRVVIDGNFGVAGNHPSQTQRTSNIIGDVNVEIKITPEGKFRVKAFNRSNTFDILNSNAPYTQGVGIFYRREFDSLNELFRKQRRTVLEIPEVDDAEGNLPD